MMGGVQLRSLFALAIGLSASRGVGFRGSGSTRSAWLLAALALALTPTACGGDAISLDPLAEASTKTFEAGTARVETETAYRWLGETATSHGTGVVDYRRRASRIAFGGPDPDSADDLEWIVIGDIEYSELPEGLPEVPTGKRWVRFDMSKAEQLVQEAARHEKNDGSSSFSIVDYGALTQRDPGRILAYLRDVGSRIDRVGPDRVRGVETARYRTHVDLRRAVRRDLEEKGWAERSIGIVLERVPADAVVAEVWVGDDGLVRRLTWNVSAEERADEIDAPVVTRTTAEFFDFGANVEIAAPPSERVIDAEDLLRSAEEE